MKKKIKWVAVLTLLVGQLHLSAQNVWTAKANVPATDLQGAKSFAIGSKGYVVTGADGNGAGSAKLYEYDQATNTWTTKANFPGPLRTDAVAFAIGTKAYVGTGTGIATGGQLSDFWEWNQSTDTWTQKAAFTGTARKFAAAFAVNGKGYVGTGWDAAMSLKSDFYEYDPAANTWTAKASFPSVRYGAAGFSIGNNGYICSGNDGAGTNFPNDMHEYDPVANTWTARASLPASGGGNGLGRNFAFTFVLGTKSYIGTGTYVDQSVGFMPMYCQDFWEYDQAANTWAQKASFPGGNRQWTIGFGIGNKGYAGTGEAGLNSYNDFWEYGAAGTGTPTGIAFNTAGEHAGMLIYPNPATDVVTFKMPQPGTYTVYDALGQLVTILDATKEQHTVLNISAFGAGVYLVRSNDNSGSVGRFVISH